MNPSPETETPPSKTEIGFLKNYPVEYAPSLTSGVFTTGSKTAPLTKERPTTGRPAELRNLLIFYNFLNLMSKIAVIADSHDNLANIEKFIAWANQNKIGLVIHCGDLAAPSVIKQEFGPKLKGEFHFVHGNVSDRELNVKVAKEFKNVFCHGDEGSLEIDGKKTAFCHYPAQAEKSAQTGKYDLVFYGHNHTPWEKTVGKTRLLNPGTLAGVFNKATFAVYDPATGKAQLLLLERL